MVSFNKHGCSTLHRLGNGTKYLVGQLFVAAFKHRRAYLNLSNKPLGVICSSHLWAGGGLISHLRGKAIVFLQSQ